MLLPLFASLLVLLSAAAPVSENPASSHPLAKRATTCSAMWGYNIAPADCAAALHNMQSLPQFKADGWEGILPLPVSTFSRTATDSRFRLPQAFTVGSCTIFVDISSHMDRVVAIRASIPDGAQSLLERCVDGLRIGGADTRNNIETVIGNEQNLHGSLRAGWEACKRVVASLPFDEHAQCLLHELEVEAQAAAQGRAQGPNGHQTSKN